MLQLQKAWCASKGAIKALESAGRALKAVGRVSKVASKASEAAGGHFGGQRMNLFEAKMGRFEAPQTLG